MRFPRLCVALALALPGHLLGQVGLDQNKVQYRRFEWHVLRGPHVDVHYYPSEAGLAPTALAYAEESYDALSLRFGHSVSTRIPLIIYASHTDFEQTNVLPFTPPEGLLGVTDYLKRRVTLPFRGSLAEFRHTLRHEMVHVFQLSLTYDTYDRSPRAAHVGEPLWWSEGLAELWSAGEDARDEMILRDFTLTGQLPTLSQLTYASGGLVYALGGRIHRWLAETYGDWRVALFYHDLWRYESFEAAIEGVYGRSLNQLNEEFQLAMRRAYYPTAERREPLTVVASPLASFAIKPSYAPADTTAGDVLYISPAKGYVTIYRRGIDGGKAKALVTAGRSADFESFHPFDSRLDPSRPGYLLLTAKFNDRDALVIWNVRKAKLAARYQFPDLVSILSPTWGPDGQSVIFSGLAESGVSDLYQLSLRDGTLQHLTDDLYQDVDPSLSPDGHAVVFASDRTAGGLEGAVNLFVKDLNTGELRQLTSGAWVDETPRWAQSNRIFFTSDRDGVLNVFSTDTLGGGRRETSAWSGAFDADYVPSRDALLVGGFHDLGLNIYYYPADSAARADTFSLRPPPPPAQSAWVWPQAEPQAAARQTSLPYRQRLTLDFVAAEAVYIPRVGGIQVVSFFLSDLLSDNLLFFDVATYQGRNFGSVFENLNVLGVYLNQSRRVNWGVGAFRSKGSSYDGLQTIAYEETSTGVLGLLRYPFSAYTRVEGEMVVEHSDRIDFTPPFNEPRRVGWLASHYLSLVHDNSLWLSTGPIDGGRVSVTAGVTSDFSNARFDSYSLSGDWRYYQRMGRRSAYAIRTMGFYSGGDRPTRINIGGTTGIRGYPYYGYIVGSKAYMLNQEVRFPLLDYLTFGFPVGDLRFPEIQGAFFLDLGKAWFDRDEHRALLGSWGVSFRWPLGPFAVLRLDWGRRFSDNNFQGYGLGPDQRDRSFLSVFFGYNY